MRGRDMFALIFSLFVFVTANAEKISIVNKYTTARNNQVEFNLSLPKNKSIDKHTKKKKSAAIANKKNIQTQTGTSPDKKKTKKHQKTNKVNSDQAKEKAKEGSKKVKNEMCTIDGTDECEHMRTFIKKSNKIVDSPVEPLKSNKRDKKQDQEPNSEEETNSDTEQNKTE